MITIFKIFLTLLLLKFNFLIFSKDKEVRSNRFTLSTGYLEDTVNSNEGMVYFPMSIYETYNWTFRLLTNEGNMLSRMISWFGTGYFQYYYFNSTFMSTPFHEFGHATRFRSYIPKSVTYTIGNPGSDTTSSYFIMFLKRIKYINNGASTRGFIPGGLSTQESAKVNIINTAGGMNNEIFLANHIAERFYQRGGSAPDLFAYIQNKLSPFDYSQISSSSGDPQSLEDDFASIGKNITRADFQKAFRNTLLASGTLYSLIWGGLKFIFTGDQSLTPIEFFGFSLPDFASFINSKGVSLQTTIRYRLNPSLNFGFSYENVYLGDSYTQISPYIYYNFKIGSGFFNTYSVNARIDYGMGDGNTDIGGSFYTEAENENFGTFLRYTFYNSKNLYGERNTPSVQKPHEVLGGVYYIFN